MLMLIGMPTPQQDADRLLIEWQANRHLPPGQRLRDAAAAPAGDPAVIAQFEADLGLVAAEMASPQ